MTTTASSIPTEALNDHLARKHDIDDYYARAPWFIRLIEQRRLSCIRRMAAAKPSDCILEVGCGGGHVLRLFPHADLVGVDVSGVMLDKARRNLAGYRVRLLKGELDSHELTANSFDKIICSEVLEHVARPDDLLIEMRRLVRTDGKIVITLPNDPLIHRLKRLVRLFQLGSSQMLGRTEWGGDEYHLHEWRIADMRRLLSRHFTIAHERFAPCRALPIRCCFLGRP